MTPTPDTQDGQFLFARLRNPAAVALCSQLQLSRRSSSLDAPYDHLDRRAAQGASDGDGIDQPHRRCGGADRCNGQVPFLTLCYAGMGYHLPSCLRVPKAVRVVEA
jgi:hypothetical protein